MITEANLEFEERMARAYYAQTKFRLCLAFRSKINSCFKKKLDLNTLINCMISPCNDYSSTEMVMFYEVE